MKLTVISIMIPILLISLAISMNFLLGMNVYQAFIDIFNPFKVMEPIELGVLFLLVGLWIFDTCIRLIRK
ncbi:hypothetical protein [Anoxybacillus sp. ST4]|uniref:hypothetical protein n=1 Tax=Anoxybacillus sp. ST4 TaxID=2864181 RepID=UPI001C6432E1|nr:hypothetical protein [Anoxybacillus sp. ST4]MBW7652170.1 hypothetical protein [Anoxybacillus sp. ST4]